MGRASIIRGNARSLPLADDSVDLVVTSPPYFALRSYQDAGEHYAGQIGDEPTPGEFVDALLEVTRECVRVLKQAGSLWVNLGDKYSSGNSGDRNTGFNIRSGNAPGRLKQERSQLPSGRVPGMQPKSLLGVPWRYAIRCIDELGLILRAEIIWSKPNGLPESVTDRVRRSHEQWFHFTLNPRYYSAVDEIREAQSSLAHHQRYNNFDFRKQTAARGGSDGTGAGMNPLGKLPGSVWEIPTEPLKVPDHLGVDHFAAFPTEWPRRIIAGWSPAGVCTACGEGRRPLADRRAVTLSTTNGHVTAVPNHPDMREGSRKAASVSITGYACACTEPTAPTTRGVVLDPFGGTGTTALVAKALGRHGISVDMSADYCRLATWRTTDEAHLAKALRVDKPRPQVDGQATLFEVQT